MKRKTTSALAATHKLALSTGKQHRAGTTELLKIQNMIRRANLPDLTKEYERFKKKAKINPQECESLDRIVRLVTEKTPSLALSEIAREVRRIYSGLRRSKTVNPIVLAIASIADDSIAFAVKESADSNGVLYQYTVPVQLGAVEADILGAIIGNDYCDRHHIIGGPRFVKVAQIAAQFSALYISSQTR